MDHTRGIPTIKETITRPSVISDCIELEGWAILVFPQRATVTVPLSGDALSIGSIKKNLCFNSASQCPCHLG